MLYWWNISPILLASLFKVRITGHDSSYLSPTGKRWRITNSCVLHLFHCHFCGHRTRSVKTNLYRATIAVKMQSWHSQLTLHACNIPNAVCATPPEDEQVMLMYRLLILNKLNERCITLISLYWYTMMHGQQNIKKRVKVCCPVSLMLGALAVAV
jgi:hypothetical protein